MSATPRELHLNAFLMEAGHHEAAWRLPESNPRADFDLQHWIKLAQLAEDAKFDSLFLADGPALTGDGEFRPPGQLEPLTLLTALADRGVAAHGHTGINVWVPVVDELSAVAALRERGWAVAPGALYRLASPPGLRITVSPLSMSDVDPLADAIVAAVAGAAFGPLSR